jgi:hypothetical protein
VLLTVELGPTEHSREREAEKHSVEEDESADGGVRVFAKNSQGNEPYGWPLEVQLLRSEVG